MDGTGEWEQRVGALWGEFDRLEAGEFRARADALAAELGEGHPLGYFERASARDATDEGAEAVPLYRKALAAGLDEGRRRQAVIQLASTLRALGDAQAGVDLLLAEQAAGSDHLDDAVTAFLALALIDTGRPREAAALALAALAAHLPQYSRSVTHYATSLLTDQSAT
ncbi:tetratricopeptide repeat protein [Actinacidiphila guanduensis]|uniref:Tetratrico peptide repeat-containing protein n=1 Tax=Actinacidiphila guanduensis TaxID=310781 RepID=A0A1H0QW18_9ACTN|nr:tetratricopeptide repeat protein [Actinacidiphila guanduensis]SDP21454.1 Tetratrico peptide repeat-containing protein [Actinacidiphila guanduensis]